MTEDLSSRILVKRSQVNKSGYCHPANKGVHSSQCCHTWIVILMGTFNSFSWVHTRVSPKSVWEAGHCCLQAMRATLLTVLEASLKHKLLICFYFRALSNGKDVFLQTRLNTVIDTGNSAV